MSGEILNHLAATDMMQRSIRQAQELRL